MVAAGKGSVMGRFSITVVMVLAIPAFAAAQHRGGGAAFSAPRSAGPSAPMISRPASAPPHANVRVQSGTQSAGRTGSTVVRSRNGVRIVHRNNNGNFGFNGADGFNSVDGFINGADGFNGTNFSNVPGLGFDYPHLAAVSGNRRHFGGRFNGGFEGGVPFGFSGFLLDPPMIVDERAAADSQVAEQEVTDDPPPIQQQAPRRSRASRPASEPEVASTPAPAPVPDVEQYVFVRRDGSLVFAVAYAWENGTLSYVTPDGLRRSIGRDALDLSATQQFNEQRGINFRAPA
jgi:hypothetical protein